MKGVKGTGKEGDREGRGEEGEVGRGMRGI